MKDKKTAVFTLVNGENGDENRWFLNVWMNYYASFFDNVFVLEHVNDESIQIKHAFGNLVKICKKGSMYRASANLARVNVAWQCAIVTIAQQLLLKEFEKVIYTDVDEIMIPGNCDLKTYVNNFKKDDVVCSGYNIIHLPTESEIDVTKPLLNQRSVMAINKASSKPLLSNHPLLWRFGFHDAYNLKNGKQPSLDLNLIHLKFISRSKLWEQRKNVWQGSIDEFDDWRSLSTRVIQLIPKYIKSVNLDASSSWLPAQQSCNKNFEIIKQKIIEFNEKWKYWEINNPKKIAENKFELLDELQSKIK